MSRYNNLNKQEQAAVDLNRYGSTYVVEININGARNQHTFHCLGSAEQRKIAHKFLDQMIDREIARVSTQF